jgi:hypothetical protein
VSIVGDKRRLSVLILRFVERILLKKLSIRVALHVKWVTFLT